MDDETSSDDGSWTEDDNMMTEIAMFVQLYQPKAIELAAPLCPFTEFCYIEPYCGSPHIFCSIPGPGEVRAKIGLTVIDEPALYQSDGFHKKELRLDLENVDSLRDRMIACAVQPPSPHLPRSPRSQRHADGSMIAPQEDSFHLGSLSPIPSDIPRSDTPLRSPRKSSSNAARAAQLVRERGSPFRRPGALVSPSSLASPRPESTSPTTTSPHLRSSPAA